MCLFSNGTLLNRARLRTYPDVMTLDVQLRDNDLLRVHPLLDLGLDFAAHEHVLLLELDEMSAKDLSYLQASVRRLPYDAHRSRVHDDFAGLLLLPSLKEK